MTLPEGHWVLSVSCGRFVAGKQSDLYHHVYRLRSLAYLLIIQIVAGVLFPPLVHWLPLAH
jgi:hypothetical protein